MIRKIAKVVLILSLMLGVSTAYAKDTGGTSGGAGVKTISCSLNDSMSSLIRAGHAVSFLYSGAAVPFSIFNLYATCRNNQLFIAVNTEENGLMWGDFGERCNITLTAFSEEFLFVGPTGVHCFDLGKASRISTNYVANPV